MSKNHSDETEEEIVELNNDYIIDTEVLSGETQVASAVSLVILSLLSLTLTVFLFTYLLDSYDFGYTISQLLIISLIISLVIYLLGGLGGFTWQKIGLWVASNTYKIYTNKFDMPIFKLFGKLYRRIVGKETVIFLEGEAIDTDYRQVIPRLKFVFTLGISQLSFFLMYLTYVWNPLFSEIEFLKTQIFPEYNQEFQIILSVVSSVATLALYLPATFILRDSNIRTWHTSKRELGQPLSKIRSTIGSLIGVGAILTGWGMYQNFVGDNELFLLSLIFPIAMTTPFLVLLDYGLLLIAIIIITAPIIYPAAVTYNFRHSNNVNQFRTHAILAGVEVGISKIREPTRQEKESIGEYINEYLT